MAKKNAFRILAMQVHGATKAVFIDLAIGALPCLHPGAVTEGLETVFPNVKEVILIDVALSKTPVNVGAGGNGADGDAGTAKIEPVTYLAFVRADVGLTTELGINLTFLSGGDDEFHQLFELLIVELHVGVVGGSSDGLDGEETPCFHVMFDEQLL